MRIIGLAPNAWHGQWVNRQQLLSRLGRTHSVTYSTGAWSIWDRGSTEWRVAPTLGAMHRSDNVIVDAAPKYLLRWPRWPRYDDFIVRAQARRLLRSDRGTIPSLTMIFHPLLMPYVRHLRSDRLAFHAYDLFEATPGWTKEHDALERALLRQADLVTAVSADIAKRLENKGQREVQVLPNGVDLTVFDAARTAKQEEPKELQGIPRPRLGYIGSLHPQVDYRLATALARKRKDWQFVFIGARVDTPDDRSQREFEECRQCKNVHFIGEIHRSRVPVLAVEMDVHLMLYRLADETWIRGIYPLKLHEYLATGKPIVSADVPSVREFSNVVRIASGIDDWDLAIDEALATGGPGDAAQRRRVASENTWDARVARLEGWFNQLIVKGHDTGANALSVTVGGD